MKFLATLIEAMILVESGGRDWISGDNGSALGCLQIHEPVIADVNAAYGFDFIHADALVPDKAKMICALYLLRYAGPRASAETCARIWNGGPDGAQRHSTLAYWEEVRECMEALQQTKGAEQ